MGGGISRMANQELLATIRDRYRESSKGEKPGEKSRGRKAGGEKPGEKSRGRKAEF